MINYMKLFSRSCTI